MATAQVHVVSKTDNGKHAVCQIRQTFSELPASSVRVRTHLISLTSNNLSYARGGGPPMRWWDVYPAPDSCPAPYRHGDQWGIVPAWGYARVLDSTIGAIQQGTLLWGMWPASGHAVQLQLEPTTGGPAGHWTETSPHRARLMTAYNRYEQPATQASSSAAAAPPTELMKETALFKVLGSGPNLLNVSTFSDRRVHPLGLREPWSAEEADLSSAVVISLSASSKTGRAFSWELARNRDVDALGPLGLLQLTSAPDALALFDTRLPVKTASYSDVNDAISWTALFRPSRIVIVDFGASDDVLRKVVETVSAASVTIIAVGDENKVYSEEELQARRETSIPKVRLNMSGLQDCTINLIGAEQYFKEAEQAWKRSVEDGTFEDITVKTLRAVEGPDGIEGAWADLCSRKIIPNIGLVIDLSE